MIVGFVIVARAFGGVWAFWDLADAQGLGRILSSAETSRTSAYHRWCFLISNSHRSHGTNIEETDQTPAFLEPPEKT